MLNKTIAAFFLGLALSQAQNVTAQELAALELTEADFFADVPVVLTATRLKQSKKNSPIATTIIDREMIEASGFTEIPDLLRLAPGMLVNYDSGHIVNAGYQFLFNRYTVRFQVLVDGRSVYTPLRGEMPWTQLGIIIDDIERIEVIRGPSSSTYGPNAMTGVISIITRDAALDSGARIKANAGVNGRSEQFFTIGDNVDGLDYKLSLGKRKGDGFEERYDNKELSIANLRGDYQVTNTDIVKFSVNYNSGDYQEDNVFDDGLSPRHTKNILNISQQIKWTHSLAGGDDVSLNYYQQKYHDRNVYTGSAGGITGTLDESLLTRRNNIEFIHTVFDENYDFSWGLLIRKDKTSSPQYLYQVANNTVYTKQVFINSELTLNKSNNFNIGFLADDNETGGRTSSHRLSLNHHFNSSNTLRVSYATATRSPFIYEEYSNYYVPDFAPLVQALTGGETDIVTRDLADLDAEKIKSIDVGLVSNFDNNETNLDVRAYKNWLTDLIILDDNLGAGFYSGEAFHVMGFEIGIKHSLNDSTKAIMNYARTKMKADRLISFNAAWFETGAPRDNASFLIAHSFGRSMNGSLGYYYTGTYQQLCCEVQQQAPRKRIDLMLSKKFKLGENSSKIKLVLQNITNEKVDTLLLNNYDRQGYLSLSLEL